MVSLLDGVGAPALEAVLSPPLPAGEELPAEEELPARVGVGAAVVVAEVTGTAGACEAAGAQAARKTRIEAITSAVRNKGFLVIDRDPIFIADYEFCSAKLVISNIFYFSATTKL
jgi:hypothetical protein